MSHPGTDPKRRRSEGLSRQILLMALTAHHHPRTHFWESTDMQLASVSWEESKAISKDRVDSMELGGVNKAEGKQG